MKYPISLVLLAGIVAAATTTPSHATIIAYEGVDYGVGVDLNAQAQPAQFGTWKAGASPGITTSSNSLAYTNGGTLDTTGNKVSGGNWQTTGMGINFSNSAWDPYETSVNNQFGAPFPMIGQGTMYVSFLLQSTAASQNAAFGVYTGDTNANVFDQLAIGATVNVTSVGGVTLRTASYDPADFAFDQVAQDGTNGLTHTVQNDTSLSVAANSVNFYVMKLEFGVTDTVSLFLNPVVGGVEGAASLTMTTPVGEELIFRSFGTYLGNSADSNFVDEIRFGSTWESVTPVPVPEPTTSAMLLGGLGGALLLRRRRLGRPLRTPALPS
jgi:hypothetical protein